MKSLGYRDDGRSCVVVEICSNEAGNGDPEPIVLSARDVHLGGVVDRGVYDEWNFAGYVDKREGRLVDAANVEGENQRGRGVDHANEHVAWVVRIAEDADRAAARRDAGAVEVVVAKCAIQRVHVGDSATRDVVLNCSGDTCTVSLNRKVAAQSRAGRQPQVGLVIYRNRAAMCNCCSSKHRCCSCSEKIEIDSAEIRNRTNLKLRLAKQGWIQIHNKWRESSSFCTGHQN